MSTALSLTRLEELFGSRAKPALVLAPMVRAGTLPLRILALHHGAQTTWSEELIAKKLMTCHRVENKELGTVDYVTGHGGAKESLVYQTCAYERGRNILQIGASNANEALAAARVVMDDVAGIDLNCGCPQHFSISGGMGAALLSKPCVAAEIISVLRKGLPPNISVSCKIRLLDTEKATMEFVQNMIAAGANAITIHARRIPERPRDKARWDELEAIAKACSVPFIVNGDVFSNSDVAKILERVPSASGVMIARGALSDISNAFTGVAQSMSGFMRDYRSVAELCASNFPNFKWFASQVIRYRSEFHLESAATRKALNEAIARSKSVAELLCAFNIPDPAIDRNTCWNGKTPENMPAVWRAAVNKTKLATRDSRDSDDQGNKRVKLE